MAGSALKQQNFIVSNNNNNKNTLFFELWGPDVTSVMFLNVSWSCCYNLEMKRFDLEVPIRKQIYSLFSIMKKQKELEECVLLHSPPGFEVFLINLSHLLSFTCQFSSRPASTGPSSCLPTVIRSSLYWNDQSKLVWWSAQQKARSPATPCSMEWR